MCKMYMNTEILQIQFRQVSYVQKGVDFIARPGDRTRVSAAVKCGAGHWGKCVFVLEPRRAVF